MTDDAQHDPRNNRRIFRLWNIAGVKSREDRLALTAAVIGRTISTSNDLTDLEVARLLSYLEHLDAEGDLKSRAHKYLTEHRITHKERTSP